MNDNDSDAVTDNDEAMQDAKSILVCNINEFLSDGRQSRHYQQQQLKKGVQNNGIRKSI